MAQIIQGYLSESVQVRETTRPGAASEKRLSIRQPPVTLTV